MRSLIFGRVRARLALGFGVAALFAAPGAWATSVQEIGDNGSEQMGRGGAWVARASDPLAAFYNPAGLAGQDTKLTLQANFNLQSTCLTRMKALNDTTPQDGVTPGGTYPQACTSGPPFPDPQIAFTYKVNPRLGLGIAILGPSAAGKQNFPDTVNGQPAPQRYMLLSGDTLLLTPTIAVGWEPVDRWRVGLGFLWGIANLDFANMSYAVNGPQAPSGNDVRSELKVKSLFIPGFTAGTIWSPTDQVDIAGWYKFLAPINAKGDVLTQSPKPIKYGDTSAADCGIPNNTSGVCGPDKATVKVSVPMEAKLGVRFHQPRPGAEMAHRRDPMSQDIFDVEADLTWANNSSFDAIHLNFPGAADGSGVLPVNGTAGGTIPPDASIPHNFKDVFGIRVGGDYNVIGDKLALRAGGYFETRAQSDQYQNIDFAGAQRIGFALGGTYRIRFSDAPKTNALEISLGFGHTFIGTMTNNGPNGIPALAGTDCYSEPGSPTAGVNASPGNTCPNGNQKYRTNWPINLGSITNSFTQINVGVSYRF